MAYQASFQSHQHLQAEGLPSNCAIFVHDINSFHFRIIDSPQIQLLLWCWQLLDDLLVDHCRSFAGPFFLRQLVTRDDVLALLHARSVASHANVRDLCSSTK
jgi:hypothetical protein